MNGSIGLAARRRAEAEVIGKVIAAYVDVRRDRKVIQILTDELTNLSQEVSETQSKGELGQLTRRFASPWRRRGGD